MSSASGVLSDRRVLLIEDEYFIAEEMSDALRNYGATVVGPVGQLKEALQLLAGSTQVDGAVLDINIGGEAVFEVADVLELRQVPFVFVTGYERSSVPERHAHVKLCQKPVETAVVVRALLG